MMPERPIRNRLLEHLRLPTEKPRLYHLGWRSLGVDPAVGQRVAGAL
jgi:hypothetical protein